MTKLKLGPQALLYPMPAFLVGSLTAGKANFITVAWGGIACGDPPMVSIAIRHTRHSLKGIMENKAFSVNIPDASLVRETDYCGIVSGAKTDKAAACRFRVFYGKQPGAPLIEQCPLNLECELHTTVNLGSHLLVIGRITECHISEECLTSGRADVNKINPIVYTTGQAQYQALGQFLGKAFSIGTELKT
ncbi:flavin reductase family protein [Dehalogenimonas sp. 4OHTPN]|uniref:Flavin reductase family protein n=1 Tax=Dehalogenimonas sp. 4OHTPN TaxID=3166643 RepID=A0AAU8GAG7_9CHLR